jgi:hypothetical protein
MKRVTWKLQAAHTIEVQKDKKAANLSFFYQYHEYLLGQDMVVEQENLDKKYAHPNFAKRLLEKNTNTTLSTSRSTPSLPNLVNYAISSATASLSKRQVADMSTSMRRGHSDYNSINKPNEQPKKQV